MALAGVAQWIERGPVNPRVTGLIPSRGSCLGCRPGPQQGVCEEQPHIDVSLPPFLLPFPSLKINIKKKPYKKPVSEAKITLKGQRRQKQLCTGRAGFLGTHTRASQGSHWTNRWCTKHSASSRCPNRARLGLLPRCACDAEEPRAQRNVIH